MKTDEEYPTHYTKAHNIQPNSSKYSGIYVPNYAPSTNAVGSMHGYSKIHKFNSTNSCSDATVIIITNNKNGDNNSYEQDDENNHDYRRHNGVAMPAVATKASAPPYYMKCSV